MPIKVQPRSRLPILKEIIDTEKIYSNHLSDVVDVCSPKLIGSKKFTSMDHVHVFLNISELRDLSVEFLRGLESAAEADGCVGEVYQNFAPKFKLYAEYCTNYPVAMKTLSALKKRHKAVRRALEACEGECGGLSLESLLIMPIQRIPRYKLLLEDIVKHTPSWHPDLVLCQNALDKIKAVAAYTNEFVRENQDSLEAVLELESQITHMPPNVKVCFNGQVPMLKQGELMKVNHKGKSEHLWFVLFPRKVVYARRRSKTKFAFEVWLPSVPSKATIHHSPSR